MHLILLKIQTMMDIKEVLLLRLIVSLIKSQLKVVVLKCKLNKTSNYLKNYTNQLLKNFKKACSSFKNTIWGADLADMQLMSKLISY